MTEPGPRARRGWVGSSWRFPAARKVVGPAQRGRGSARPAASHASVVVGVVAAAGRALALARGSGAVPCCRRRARRAATPGPCLASAGAPPRSLGPSPRTRTPAAQSGTGCASRC
eukprot:1602372-Rhodomonas_salina.1